MKITNLTTGQAYQLAPGTQLEIERPNLFFNDYGEQSYPVDLPDTDLNRALCGYPDLPANRRKPQTDIPAAISEGDYYMPCRQAVLGVKRKEKITTSFYMNEGSFLSRMQDVPLVDVFGDETVPGVSTVEEGIAWCWSLMADEDPHYGIFPAIVQLDGVRRALNAAVMMDEDGNLFEWGRRNPSTGLPEGIAYGFWNAFPRRETVDSRVVQLSPGYYITPFIRANYLLQRVFAYFGYTLQNSFFNETKPFDKMLFVNNTADALVNGTILVAHLVPDCYCNTLIDVFRRKFCCEFVPDETEHTVRIEFFKDILAATPSDDLTSCLVGYPEFNFQAPRQLKLSSDTSLSEGESFEGAGELKRKYPTAYINYLNGQFERIGYTSSDVVEVLSDGNIPYYAGEPDMEDYEVNVPDSQYCYGRDPSIGEDHTMAGSFPYIGDGRMLNSVLEGDFDPEESGGDLEAFESSEHKQDPMLSFTNPRSYYNTGTHTWATYSLLYNGAAGIYEKFWRDFDNLLRNALHQVTASLLLDNDRKRNLSSHKKTVLDGSEYLVNIIRYTLGGSQSPVDSDLFTILMQEPVSMALPHSEQFTRHGYTWKAHVDASASLTEEEWTAAGYTAQQEVTAQAIYPSPPTKAQYEAGGSYHIRTVYYSKVRYDDRGNPYWSYMKVTVSLIPDVVE